MPEWFLISVVLPASVGPIIVDDIAALYIKDTRSHQCGPLSVTDTLPVSANLVHDGVADQCCRSDSAGTSRHISNVICFYLKRFGCCGLVNSSGTFGAANSSHVATAAARSESARSGCWPGWSQPVNAVKPTQYGALRSVLAVKNRGSRYNRWRRACGHRRLTEPATS